MKKLFLGLSLLLCHSLMAQITLEECIEAGLKNKANIKTAQAEVLLANLKSIESRAKFLPQIALAYDYRYNPIIATQIVPIGQLNPEPTDEVRAIQFGTNWQQNAGVTLYQPIVDFAIRSRIKESKLNKYISGLDLKKAEEELKFEIVNAYSRALVFRYQVDETIADTTRSFQSLAIIQSKFSEGKILKSELNRAFVNHNANLKSFKNASAAWVNEKIYLHFLTNIRLERILEESFSGLPEQLFSTTFPSLQIQYDSLIDFQKITFQELLINQQIRTERNKNSPTIGFQGFIGANQFSQQFEPFLGNAWFGNSFVGLTVKLPIFSPEKSINGGKQLQTQLTILQNERAELRNTINKDILQINLEIDRLKAEIKLAENNLNLLKENIKLYQDRLQAGQFTIAELNTEESEVQKISSQIQQLTESLSKAKIQRLYIAGILGGRLNNK